MRAILFTLAFLVAGTVAADERIINLGNGKVLRITGENIKVKVIKLEDPANLGGGGEEPTTPPKSGTAAKVKALTDGMANPEIKIVLVAVLRTTKTEAELKKRLDALLPAPWKPWRDGVSAIINDLARRGEFDTQAEVGAVLSDIADGVEASLAGQGLFSKIKLKDILPIVLQLLTSDDKLDLKAILKIIIPLLL